MVRNLTLSVVMSVACFANADDRKDALSKLEGSYTVVGGEMNGKMIPKAEIAGSIVIFKANKIVGTDKDKKEFFASNYKIDSSTKPYKIDMISTAPKGGAKASGILEIDGDIVKICYNLPGGEVPTDFKTKEKQHCFILKRDEK